MQNEPIELNDDELNLITGGVGANGSQINGMTNGVGTIDLSSMDIETALMMVQQQRTQLLDSQLQSQINDVQKRNETMGHLNEHLSSLNSLLGTFKGDAKSEETLKLDAKVGEKTVEDIIKSLNPNYLADIDGNGKMTMGELEQAVRSTKAMIDAESNSQQMDMLRLQSMNNKRNEAFDVMTNFVKKMQDSRSSIIGNMR